MHFAERVSVKSNLGEHLIAHSLNTAMWSRRSISLYTHRTVSRLGPHDVRTPHEAEFQCKRRRRSEVSLRGLSIRMSCFRSLAGRR